MVPHLLPPPSSLGVAEAMKPQKPGKPSFSLYLPCDHVIPKRKQGSPGDAVVKNPPANAGDAGDMGLSPG